MLRVYPDHLADALVGNTAGRFVQLARRVAVFVPRLVRELLDLILQVRDLLVHLVLLLLQPLRPALARGPLLLLQTSYRRLDLALLVRQRLSLPLHVLQIAIATADYSAAAALAAFPQRPRAPACAARRRPVRWPPLSHRVGGCCSCRTASLTSCRG